jgi:hypothetical protein
MTKKDYKTLNYYECPKCTYIWSELNDEDCSDQCPNCSKESVEPFESFKDVLDWDNHYTLVKNHIHPEQEHIFETYGKDLEYIKQYDPNHVWTIVDDDYGQLGIIKGIHLVNRQYYVISKESHENDYENYNY